MPMLKGGKYDGRHSDWVPAAYLKTKEGKAAMGVAEPKAEPKPDPKSDAGADPVRE